MISDRTRVRLRAALDEWFALVVVALVALALVGGWAAYGSLAATETDVDRETVEAWSTTGGFEHGATVQAENEVFPVGTELSDRPVYYTEITPELESTFRFGYDAPTGDVDVDIVAERVIRSVDDDGAEYWATNETLATTTAAGVAPGDERALAFELDVPATTNETDAIEESLGGSAGTVETVVVVEVKMTGTIDGEPVDRVETYELAVDADGSTYSVDAPTAERRAEHRTESVSSADAAGLGSLAPALLSFASLCALGVLAVARVNGTLAPTEADLERVRDEYEREEFDDWISRGRLPADVRERSRIEVATLEDLVDVAIDCDRRVIEDERAGEYYVVDGESLYVYEPESFPADATDGSSDEVGSSGDAVGPERTSEGEVVADGSGSEDGTEDSSD